MSEDDHEFSKAVMGIVFFIIMGLVLLIPSTSFADVSIVRVTPKYITKVVQECKMRQVVIEERAGAGALSGGIVGGVAGHQVGGGSGKTAATILGAIIGTGVGRRVAEENPKITEREICSDVEYQEQSGEIVTFEYNGKIFTQSFDE